MWELLAAGGKAMIPIGIAAVVALAIILERFWSLRRKEVLPPNLPGEVRNWAQHRRLDEEHLKALAETSPLGSVFAAALRARHLGREAIKERVEDAGRHVMHDMEKFLNTLGTIALISPLLGLFGTVIGLINMFLAILNSGIGDANQMAGGIGEALVCTAAGLSVAIPAYIFHRHLRAKVVGLGIELEKEVVALIDTIEAEVPVQVAAARRAAK
ncbi:MAG: MotA/TolQ/ExbB proton channel family protein [Xanthomonadales bacterium]|nr:MotA/TolQ/ExbB proton channel family protein [Xanthomonadales bacterium]MCC6560401.1 MotA/TolQ/ExbB proton channel family protein [Xanthomonadales bacterium]